MDGLIVLFSALTFLIFLVSLIRFDTLVRWQEAILKILDGTRNRPIRFVFFAALFGFLGCSLRINTLRLPPVWHRSILCFVCLYTFVFFNPIQAVSNAKAVSTVLCPDGLAYRLVSGHYIRCEDFDEFHADLARGTVRADLYIGLQKGR